MMYGYSPIWKFELRNAVALTHQVGALPEAAAALLR